MHLLHVLFLVAAFFLERIPDVFSKTTLSTFGGITLNSNGTVYEVTTNECPGGIFLTQAVDEACMCYHGIFAIIRDCCTQENGLITTDTIEWRKNFQCGPSPEIRIPEGKPIRAVLPLTKAEKPFRPVLTFQEFSKQSFSKWRKFDLITLSSAPEPTSFVNSSTVEIINVAQLPKQVRFKIGKYGDVDICYSGWYPKKPQTLRISVYEYSMFSKSNPYCCFQVRESNSPGIITSHCREGSVITEMVEIESVNKGNSCPHRKPSGRHMTKKTKQGHKKSPAPKNLIRFKRSEPGALSPAQAAKVIADSKINFKRQSDDGETEVKPSETDGEKSNDDEEKPKDEEKSEEKPIDEEKSADEEKSGDEEKTDEEKSGDEEKPDEGKSSPIKGEDEEEPDEISYTLQELADDTLHEQHVKLRVFTVKRKQGLPEAIKEPRTQRFVFLKKSLEIMQKVVPKSFVDDKFLTDIFEAFYFLYEVLDTDDLALDEDKFDRVMYVLETCLEKANPWKAHVEGEADADDKFADAIIIFQEDTCPPLEKDVKVRFPNRTELEIPGGPKIPDWLNFEKDKVDMIVDGSWKIVDFVHSYCFDHFFNDYNAHHFYENQLEILFLEKYVQERWQRNILEEEEGFRYLKHIVGDVYRYESMFNMDRAIAIAHTLSRYTYYLHRPSTDVLIPESDLYQQVQFYEGAVKVRLSMAREKLRRRHRKFTDDDNYFLPDSMPSLTPFWDKNLLPIDESVGEEDSELVRSKKHIGTNIAKDGKHMHKSNQNLKRNAVKPGDSIWDGLAICLDAKSNDDPAYYTQQELWGTNPGLGELGRKYPLSY